MKGRRFDLFGCAHSWAHQSAQEGHASNLYFSGRIIYSYGSHFPIAYHDGDTIYLTTQNYSKSTSNHIRIVRGAISHKRIIYVHVVPLHDPHNNLSFHTQNVFQWLVAISNQVGEYTRHPRRSKLLAQIQETINLLREFVTEFPAANTPEVKRVLESDDVAAIQAFFQEQQKKEEKKKAIEEKKRIRLEEAKAAAWEKGEVRTLDSYYGRNMTLLRVRDGKLETSKGIRMTLSEAAEVYKYYMAVVAGAEPIEGYAVQGFPVDYITAETLRIGCHTISRAQIDKIALELGWS